MFKDHPASTIALSHQDWSALGLNQDVKREEEEESMSSKSWITALREVRERSREKKRLPINHVCFFEGLERREIFHEKKFHSDELL